MKKHFYLLACVISSCFLASCEPQPEPEVIPQSFPKKHLLEEFTSQNCGFSPSGLDAVNSYISNDTNWVIVHHHAGFVDDHFTVAGSKRVAQSLSISGSPMIAINRSITRVGNSRAMGFHPGNLGNVNRDQFDNETYASIEWHNHYDASTRTLNIGIKGMLCKTDHPELKMTVVVKESGMEDVQADAMKTFLGWKRFRHTHAVRAFVSQPLGDEIQHSGTNKYTTGYTIQLDESWVAENCMVVAFLSEEDGSIVQAAECAVVDGSTGGAEIVHGGIEKNPVPSHYPEPEVGISPSTFYNGSLVMSHTTVKSRSYANNQFKLWTLTGYNPTINPTIDNAPTLPLVYIFALTDTDATNLPNGTYPINSSIESGSVIAGYRDDANTIIDGTTFYYADKAYFDQNYLYGTRQWLIVSGALQVTEDGWSLNGQTLNGSTIELSGSW